MKKLQQGLWIRLCKHMEYHLTFKLNYWIELKTLWQNEKLLIMSNFFFCHNVFESCLLHMHQNACQRKDSCGVDLDLHIGPCRISSKVWLVLSLYWSMPRVWEISWFWYLGLSYKNGTNYFPSLALRFVE